MSCSSTDKQYMLRALELARLGKFDTSPNPMVGCVIVNQFGKIIGEGYHHKAGAPHAEVNAYRSVSKADYQFLAESTFYVTLEPCSHYGKTPPCAKLLCEIRPKRVVVAMQDPFPQVAGRGIALLRDAGIDVEVGLCQEEAEQLNKYFLTSVRKKRPYILLKWAQTCNGFLDYKRDLYDGKSALHISSPLDTRSVHKLRATFDAILVGKRTALLDNPMLTTRYGWGKSPIVYILADSVDFPATLHLLQETGDRIRILSPEIGQSLDVLSILKRMNDDGIRSLIVEGGAEVLNLFVKAKLFDEIRRFSSPFAIESGIKAPQI